ncbi:uncharacterized protein LOC117233455 [Bombus vosnesenskii]|uniref:Uncharacterized protein LOC117233455 n=1 Tax=Bombus vosnesenskii TaxID=207650 RepID=A0A6J3KCC1_9HYME|nr:uncharacterized protein LOC117233455 [Bombus vosnesenskii]
MAVGTVESLEARRTAAIRIKTVFTIRWQRYQSRRGRVVGRVRKRRATQRKGKKKLQRNGTVRIQTDRTVSDRIIALQRERTEKDHRMVGRSVGRGTSTLSKRTRMYVKVTLTIQRRSGTCWCFMVSAVWLRRTNNKVKNIRIRKGDAQSYMT